MVAAAVLVLLTGFLVARACRERCQGAAVQEYVYTRFHREDEEGQESLLWERLSLVKELLLQVADIMTDVIWSSSMLSKGHITFGLLNICIVLVASLARFTVERLNWKQAGQDEDTEKFVQQLDRRGNRKPGPSRLFAHLFQLNTFIDGWKRWRGDEVPVWTENLVIEGVCEGIPSFILQMYAMLLLRELETMSSWELARQLVSQALSLRSASVALNRLNVGLDADLPFGLLLFRAADLGSRLLLIALVAVVMRRPGQLHEAHQSVFFFALLISAGLTLLITVHAANKKQEKTVIIKSALCGFFGTPFLSVPKGAYLWQQRGLRYAMVLLHNLEAALVNVAICLRWGKGYLYGEPMALAHLSHLVLWLAASVVLVADEASLRCVATPILPTGREWQTLEWASALGMATLVENLARGNLRFGCDCDLSFKSRIANRKSISSRRPHCWNSPRFANPWAWHRVQESTQRPKYKKRTQKNEIIAVPMADPKIPIKKIGNGHCRIIIFRYFTVTFFVVLGSGSGFATLRACYRAQKPPNPENTKKIQNPPPKLGPAAWPPKIRKKYRQKYKNGPKTTIFGPFFVVFRYFFWIFGGQAWVGDFVVFFCIFGVRGVFWAL